MFKQPEPPQPPQMEDLYGFLAGGQTVGMEWLETLRTGTLDELSIMRLEFALPPDTTPLFKYLMDSAATFIEKPNDDIGLAVNRGYITKEGWSQYSEIKEQYLEMRGKLKKFAESPERFSPEDVNKVKDYLFKWVHTILAACNNLRGSLPYDTRDGKLKETFPKNERDLFLRIYLELLTFELFLFSVLACWCPECGAYNGGQGKGTIKCGNPDCKKELTATIQKIQFKQLNIAVTLQAVTRNCTSCGLSYATTATGPSICPKCGRKFCPNCQNSSKGSKDFCTECGYKF